MTNKQQLLLDCFRRTVKPEQKRDIVDWAYEFVKLDRSSRSDSADLKQTPWLIQPLEAILGNNADEIVVLAPTGGGKSTMLEIAITYIVAEKPGPTLACSQSDTDTYEWCQTGIKPALQKCELVKDLWPTKKNMLRKDFIQFPHMVLYIGGANHNNLQSKSCDYVFLDEAWVYKEGLIQEARRRTHDRFNSRVVIASQAGTTEDDLNIAWNMCYKHEYAFKCRSCGEYHPYRFEDVKFDCEKQGEEYIWETLVAWYECPSCGEKYDDDVTNRREMSSTGKYIQGHNENPITKHYGYHFSALNVWWIPWSRLVTEFLKAKQYASMGNLNYLKQFNQKRLAKAWSDVSMAEESITKIGDYSIKDAKLWDVTLVCCDVQKRDIYYTVRTWAKNGDSRLLEADKILDWHSLEQIQKKYDLPSNHIFLDSAYRTEEVKGVLSRYSWMGLNGRSEAYYTIRDPKTGKSYKRLFSTPNRHRVGDKEAVITYYSSNSIKDVLMMLKTGSGAYWGVPYDVDPEYISQMNSEIKMLGPGGKPFYKKVYLHNHLFDTEVMQVCAAMMWRCFPNVIPNE